MFLPTMSASERGFALSRVMTRIKAVETYTLAPDNLLPFVYVHVDELLTSGDRVLLAITDLTGPFVGFWFVLGHSGNRTRSS